MKNAFEYINKYFKGFIVEQAKHLNYSAENVLILEYKFKELSSKYMTTYKNIVSCKNQRDKREPLEFARDIIANWIFEDFVLDLLSNDSLKVVLSGGDKNREILHALNVTHDSDFIIKKDGKKYKLELMANYTSYWLKFKKFHLRNDKFDKLIKSKSLLLGVCTENKKFILLDFINPPLAKHMDKHPDYDKPAKEIEIDSTMKFFDLSSDNLITQINSLINKRNHKNS